MIQFQCDETGAFETEKQKTKPQWHNATGMDVV